MNKERLYILLIVACIAGYSWVTFTCFNSHDKYTSEYEICLIKNTFHIPCPSCGATRSLQAFLNGEFKNALLLNPIGILLFFIMTITPFWLLFDYVKKKDSLFIFYKKSEQKLRQKWVAIPALGLVVCNWIWNIYKEL